MSAGIQVGDLVWKFRGDLNPLTKALTGSMGLVQKHSKLLLGVGAGIVGALGLAGGAALKVANTVDASSKRMAVALGLPIEAAEDMRQIIREVYGEAFGESMKDAAQAAQDTALQLKKLGITGTKEIAKTTKMALALRDTFEIDVNESVGAATTLMDQFGLTGTEAMNFITSGFQRGLNSSDDFIQSIGEFSVQFAEGGADAGNFFSVLESGLQGGMLGTDKAADMFKEFRVRIQDGSKATAEGLAQIGISSVEFLKKLASGQMTVAQAFTEVQSKLRLVGDQGIQMRAGVSLLGTQFEDLGVRAALSINMITTKMGDLQGANDLLNKQYSDLGTFMVEMKRRVELMFETIGHKMLPIINEHMPAIRQGFKDLEKLAPVFAKIFADGLDLMLDKLIPAVEWMAKFGAEHQGLIKWGTIAAGVFGSLALGLGTIGMVITPLLGAAGFLGLGGAATGAAGIAGGAGVAGLTSALIGPLGLVVALTAAGVLTYTAIGAIQDYRKHTEWAAQSTKDTIRTDQALIEGLLEKGLGYKRASLELMNHEELIALARKRTTEATAATREHTSAIVGATGAAQTYTGGIWEVSKATTQAAEADKLHAAQVRAARIAQGAYNVEIARAQNDWQSYLGTREKLVTQALTIEEAMKKERGTLYSSKEATTAHDEVSKGLGRTLADLDRTVGMLDARWRLSKEQIAGLSRSYERLAESARSANFAMSMGAGGGGGNIPTMATGGTIKSAGLVSVHKDETIILPMAAEVLPRQHSAQGAAMMGGGGRNVTIESGAFPITIDATGMSDVGELANRLESVIAEKIASDLDAQGVLTF